MRVLFLTSSYPVPEFPALGIFVREHALARRATPTWQSPISTAPSDARSIHVEDATTPTSRPCTSRYPASPAPVSYLSNVVAAALAYRRLRTAGFDPDVIHAHFFLAGAPAVLLGRLLRKPVVVTEQWSVFLPDDPMTLSRSMQRVARFTFEHADTGHAGERGAARRHPAIGTQADFRVVPNVVDTGSSIRTAHGPTRAAPPADRRRATSTTRRVGRT